MHASSNFRTAPVASAPQHVHAGRALAAASVLAIAYATLVPAPHAPVTATFCLVCGERGGVDVVLNLLLFAPLGAGLALANARGRYALAFMTLLSAFIETMQRSIIPGRDASIGDLLFNSVGGALGFLLLTHRDTLLRPQPRTAARLFAGWCIAWLGVQALVSYALSPSWPALPYFAQVAHAVPTFDRFPGTVLAARLGAATLRDGRISNAPRAREQLLHATPVIVTVRTAGPTRRTAPMLRIADSSRRGVLLIAQRGTSVLFTARTGADRMRLRPPMFEVPRALASDITRDARVVTLAARRDDGAMELTIIRDGAASVHRLELSTALGWTLVLPAQWRLTDGIAERILSLMWVAGLLVPLGYWSTRASASLVALSLFALPAGLSVIPLTFALPVASPLEWCAAMVGLVLGGTAGVARVRRATHVAAHAAAVERRPHSAATPRQESATA